MKRWNHILQLFLVFLLGAAVSLGAVCLRASQLRKDASGTAAQKTAEIENYLQRYFVAQYDETELADAVADAMVKATRDRWSYYISAADFAASAAVLLPAAAAAPAEELAAEFAAADADPSASCALLTAVSFAASAFVSDTFAALALWPALVACVSAIVLAAEAATFAASAAALLSSAACRSTATADLSAATSDFACSTADRSATN